MIWNTHHIPTADTFSFTTSNHAYIPHEWLSQLAIYAAYHFAGYAGLMLWLCALSSLIVIAGYALCALHSGNAKIAFLGGLITWLFSTYGLAIRPHMIGFLLLLCELLILHLARARSAKWFFALPPLFALWVNCHGSFFLGLLVLGIVLACSFWDVQWGLLVSRSWSKHDRHTLVLAFALSMAALFLNPVGLSQVMYPLNTLGKQQVQMHAVSEWQALQFTDVRSLALLGIAGLILFLPLVRKRRLFLSELLLSGMGFALAIQHQRMMFVFGILAAPVVCRLVADTWDRYDPARDRILPNAIMLALATVVLFFSFPRPPNLEAQVEKGNPVDAVDFLKASGLTGRLLNQYVYGGYLIWSAPARKVFIDGRGDVFEWTGVLQEYGRWATLQTDPRQLLDKYRISICMLAPDAPMARVLALLPGWNEVYKDDLAVIFARQHR